MSLSLSALSSEQKQNDLNIISENVSQRELSTFLDVLGESEERLFHLAHTESMTGEQRGDYFRELFYSLPTTQQDLLLARCQGWNPRAQFEEGSKRKGYRLISDESPPIYSLMDEQKSRAEEKILEKEGKKRDRDIDWYVIGF